MRYSIKNGLICLLSATVLLTQTSCDPAVWEALSTAVEQNQAMTTNAATGSPSTAQYTNTTGCNELRVRKSYQIITRKTVNGVTTTKRYEARTENYLMYLVEYDANGRVLKRIDAGGEPLPAGLDFRAELRQEMDYVYGSDGRLKLEQQLKMVPLFFYCKPWTAQLVN